MAQKKIIIALSPIKVRADIRDISKAGGRGFPSVFINGRRLRKRNLKGFSKMIEKKLQNAENSLSKK